MVKKGLWSPEEDEKLRYSIAKYVNGSWSDIAERAGLQRCGRSCRQRWLNHLRPGLKKGKFSTNEIKTILELQAKLGNRWCEIAAHLEGRTDNEVKNLWNSVLKRRSSSHVQRSAHHHHRHRLHPHQIQSEDIHSQQIRKEGQKYSASYSTGIKNGVLKSTPADDDDDDNDDQLTTSSIANNQYTLDGMVNVGYDKELYFDRCRSFGRPPSVYMQLPLSGALTPNSSPLMASLSPSSSSSSSSSSSIMPDFASPPPHTIPWNDLQTTAAHLHMNQNTAGQLYCNTHIMPALSLDHLAGIVIPNMGSDYNLKHAPQQFLPTVNPGHNASILTSLPDCDSLQLKLPARTITNEAIYSAVDITSVLELGGTNYGIEHDYKYRGEQDIGCGKPEALTHYDKSTRSIDPLDDDDNDNYDRLLTTSASLLDHLLAQDCLMIGLFTNHDQENVQDQEDSTIRY